MEEEEEEGGEFWFPLLLSHNDAIHSYETPHAAHWLIATGFRGWTETGPITPARLWKTKQRRGGGTVSLTDTLWFKLLTSAILCLQQNVFPIQTMTNCVLYRLNKWILFVYMETHSTVGQPWLIRPSMGSSADASPKRGLLPTADGRREAVHRRVAETS